MQATLVDSAGKPTRLHDLTTFYPGVLLRTDAQGVRIDTGEERSGVDIRLKRGQLLSIKGRIAGGSDALSQYRLSAVLDEGGRFTGDGNATILTNGEFIVTEVTPGVHNLMLINAANGWHVVGQPEVNVSDEDVSGIVITPVKPAQVRVRVVLEGEEDKPLTNGVVSLTPAEAPYDPNTSFSQHQTQNGTYMIDDVRPGKYAVWFSNASEYYLKSVESGNALLNPNSIDIGEGAVINLRTIFSRNVASLFGDVEFPQDQPKPAAHVFILSEDDTEPSDRRYSWPELDQYFHFSLSHLRPGKYLAFAAEDDDPDMWNSPDFVKALQSQGAEIELHEKESATVHLKLIPKSETDRVRKQLGL